MSADRKHRRRNGKRPRPQLPDLLGMLAAGVPRAQVVLLLSFFLLDAAIQLRTATTPDGSLALDLRLPADWGPRKEREFLAWVQPFAADLRAVAAQGEADHRRHDSARWN